MAVEKICQILKSARSAFSDFTQIEIPRATVKLVTKPLFSFSLARLPLRTGWIWCPVRHPTDSPYCVQKSQTVICC